MQKREIIRLTLDCELNINKYNQGLSEKFRDSGQLALLRPHKRKFSPISDTKS